MGRSLALLLILALLVAQIGSSRAWGPYTCPTYDSIRDPSVDASSFSIAEIKGLWYLQATTEPTTRFCKCNMMNFSIGSKTYNYTDTCFEDVGSKSSWSNFSKIEIGGDLSSDPRSPGILHEGFEIFGHAVMKKPNFLFNVSRDEKTGELNMLRFYACLGKLTPFSKKPAFSYLLYTRRMDGITEAGARALVEADRATGLFDLDGVVYTNRSSWKGCGY